MNDEFFEAPEELSEDFYENWLYKIKPATPASTVTLLDADAYTKLVG